jgi:hypothetical protein
MPDSSNDANCLHGRTAPKALNVIARPSGPGVRGRDEQNAEGAKCVALFKNMLAEHFETKSCMPRFQRSESICSPVPGPLARAITFSAFGAISRIPTGSNILRLAALRLSASQLK